MTPMFHTLFADRLPALSLAIYGCFTRRKTSRISENKLKTLCKSDGRQGR